MTKGKKTKFAAKETIKSTNKTLKAASKPERKAAEYPSALYLVAAVVLVFGFIFFLDARIHPIEAPPLADGVMDAPEANLMPAETTQAMDEMPPEAAMVEPDPVAVPDEPVETAALDEVETPESMEAVPIAVFERTIKTSEVLEGLNGLQDRLSLTPLNISKYFDAPISSQIGVKTANGDLIDVVTVSKGDRLAPYLFKDKIEVLDVRLDTGDAGSSVTLRITQFS
jgi:preprotein translocase subunit Sss1